MAASSVHLHPKRLHNSAFFFFKDLFFYQIIFVPDNGLEHALKGQIVFTASELGVFDLLLESGEPLSSGAIAERLGTSPSGTERLLEACAGLKLLRMERKDSEGLYRNTNVASLYLAKSSPKSQYYYMKLLSEYGYASFQYFTDAVRSKEEVQRFFCGMDDAWSLYGQEVLSAFDLSHFPIIYDLGGGSGALAKQCISLYPNTTVTVLDRPEVVETAKKHLVSSGGHQIAFQEGDFFNDPVPEADLYILARILYNWDDEKCIQLLRKLNKVCKPGMSTHRAGADKVTIYEL
uniref:Acetylserotonin O-methyltransferase n=1 Tax=Pogona vitticeps TaxID=103695 RepID=A0ABM5FVB9_9SAUR